MTSPPALLPIRDHDGPGVFGSDLADSIPKHSCSGEPDPEPPREKPTGSRDDAQLAAWIDRIVDRDERALSALYESTVSLVYGLVLRIVRRPQWAEEVVEDVYFQVWRTAPRFDAARGQAMTWLLSMARSRALDALRREGRFACQSLDDEDAPVVQDAAVPGPEDLVDTARGAALLRQALLGLGAESRQLVALAFFQGLTHEEIATRMSMPLGTVKSRIRRAVITLGSYMGKPDRPALLT